jgi:hypothetical protein
VTMKLMFSSPLLRHTGARCQPARASSGVSRPARAPRVNQTLETRSPTSRDGVSLKAGALLVREWSGKLERVMSLEQGFAWNGGTYRSLSQIAKAMTGTSWNGHRFFGLRTAKPNRSATPGLGGGVCDGVPLEKHRKVRRDAGSPGVARAANGGTALVCRTRRRDSGKAASP